MKLIIILKQFPLIGILSGLTSFLLPFIKTSLPYIQYGGACMGLAISALTLYIKLKEARKISKD